MFLVSPLCLALSAIVVLWVTLDGEQRDRCLDQTLPGLLLGTHLANHTEATGPGDEEDIAQLAPGFELGTFLKSGPCIRADSSGGVNTVRGRPWEMNRARHAGARLGTDGAVPMAALARCTFQGVERVSAEEPQPGPSRRLGVRTSGIGTCGRLLANHQTVKRVRQQHPEDCRLSQSLGSQGCG
jgi:hypothetical protein